MSCGSIGHQAKRAEQPVPEVHGINKASSIDAPIDTRFSMAGMIHKMPIRSHYGVFIEFREPLQIVGNGSNLLFRMNIKTELYFIDHQTNNGIMHIIFLRKAKGSSC